MSRYFYSGWRLTTKVSADNTCSVFAGADVVIGEVSEQTRWLLAVDRQNSIFKVQHSRSYSPYGFDQAALTASLLAYKGEHRDVTSGCDLLGNGVRAYSPVLMRFCSPDVISPFGAGGINAYVYCEADPINYLDTDGRMKVPVIPSPWASKQPYGISQRSRAIQRVSPPSPLSAMSKMVEALPENGYLPLPRVHPEGASSQPRRSYSSLHAVPKEFWEKAGELYKNPNAVASVWVNDARTKGLINTELILDQLLISAISYKIETRGARLTGWGERDALSELGFKSRAIAQSSLSHRINTVVRSRFSIAASASSGSVASRIRRSGN
ncbi:RHS repeat-associated core domain-containing protein [Pseudomonas sp. NBRC 111132]|uniref:RHS repeat-associated core domain-containing protein n=1 Tax=Pseudomonas sp. NBRC 111132 TaxID=1661047 RepID=UPI0009EB46C2|nr:RHS repeat-associated core domain-containing protein [Pseudomonas sp. NBRC 111132]